MTHYATVDELLGKTLSSIDADKESPEIIFTTTEGHRYKMYHDQDCCESVYVDDIDGDLSDLIGSPITLAEERTDSDENPKDWCESFTWTFYTFATVKGYVTIKWFGSSNGYYSESVTFAKID